MAFVVDLDPGTDRLLSAHLALRRSRLTKAEFTARLVRFAVDCQPETPRRCHLPGLCGVRSVLCRNVCRLGGVLR
jgi:hypothetical protein